MQLHPYFLPRKVIFRITYMLLLLLIATCMKISVRSPISAAGGTASFSIQPGIFDSKNPLTKSYFIFNSNPSMHVSSRVHVVNTGTARGTVNIYAVDATTSTNGGITYLEHTAQRHDVGIWVTLSKLRLTLDAGKSQDVSFMLTVPRNATSGQHVGGIVAESISLQNSVSRGRKGSINVKLTLKNLYVVPLVVNIPGPIKEELLTSGVQFDSADPFQRVLIKLSNVGNVMISPKGSAIITDSRGRSVQSTQLNMSTFLPHTSIQYPLNILKKALHTGNYKVKIVLTYGKSTKGKLEAVFPFQVKKAGRSLATLASQRVEQESTNIFASLSLWQYVLGGVVLLLAISALFFWMQKLYTVIVHIQRKDKS